MAVYRQVQVSFWQDDFILELTPEEKYFYLYLMLSSKSSQCGIYRISPKIMEFETGYNLKKIKKLLRRFVDYKKILYAEEANEIMILSWVKYNFIDSKNTITCMNKELKEVKSKEFLIRFYEICLNRGYNVEEIFKDIDIEELLKGQENITVNYKKVTTSLRNKEKSYSKNSGSSCKEGMDYEDNITDYYKENTACNKNSGNSCKESTDYGDNITDYYKESTSCDKSTTGNKSYKDNTITLYEGSTTSKKVYEKNTSSHYEGAYKDLGEEEEKEEEEIEEKEEEEIEAPSNHNFNDETKNMNSIKVLSEFNNTIRQATIYDIQEISKWRNEFEDEIIMEAIKEAVKYNGKSSKYIDSILKNWRTLGLDTYEKVKNRNKRYKKPEDRPNSDAYKYVD